MVPTYLKGDALLTLDKIVDLQYHHKHSGNIKQRDSDNRSAKEAKEQDKKTEKKKARWLLLQWAVETVEDEVSKEGEEVLLKSGGLHFADKVATWMGIHEFSILRVLSIIEAKGPITFRILRAVAFAPEECPQPTITSPNQPTVDASNQPATVATDQPPIDKSNQSSSIPTFAEHFSKTPPSGKGSNPPDPLLVSMPAFCLTLNINLTKIH